MLIGLLLHASSMGAGIVDLVIVKQIPVEPWPDQNAPWIGSF